MNIEKEITENEMLVVVSGKLNTSTSGMLESEMQNVPDEVTKLVFDLKELEYISSAGIRVIISTLKKMKEKSGDMVLKNLSDDVYDVFDLTGLTDVLDIEE